MSCGNFESFMALSLKARDELKWLIHNIRTTSKAIKEPDFSITLYIDDSLEGWGAFVNGNTFGGRWNDDKKELHINLLELKAVNFMLKSVCAGMHSSHIRIRADNSAAVGYINNMGGTKSVQCHEVAMEIRMFVIERALWFSAEHVPGSDNILADSASLIFHDDSEWVLVTKVFHEIECFRKDRNLYVCISFKR